MPLTYIPKSATETYNDLPVLCIYLVAHEKYAAQAPGLSSNSAQPHTNHWVIHLATSQAQSIKLDPSPDANNTMTLIVSRGELLYSNSAVKVIQLRASPNLTVGNIIDYICQSNYDHYQFDSSGQGCRYWVCSVTSLFNSAGYVTDNAQVETAKQALQRVWDENGSPSSSEQQSGITAGRFC